MAQKEGSGAEAVHLTGLGVVADIQVAAQISLTGQEIVAKVEAAADRLPMEATRYSQRLKIRRTEAL
jgi:hypothetical protein